MELSRLRVVCRPPVSLRGLGLPSPRGDDQRRLAGRDHGGGQRPLRSRLRLTLWEPQSELDAELVHSVLELVFFNDTPPTEKEVAKWTRLEMLLAYDWA